MSSRGNRLVVWPRAKFGAAIGASLLLSLLIAAPVAATHVTPVLVAGNPFCSDTSDEGGSGPDLGFDHGIKIEPPGAGTFNVGPGTVTISNVNTSVNPATFTWTSSGVIVAAISVKGGSDANVYYYNPPATTTDSGLHAPNGFSHINICWNDQPPGSLKITKTVTGGPQGFSGSFDVHVDCGQNGTFDRTIAYPGPGLRDHHRHPGRRLVRRDRDGQADRADQLHVGHRGDHG